MKKILTFFCGTLLSLCGFAQSWSLTGNAGTSPATNFLGTTDAQRLVFRTNNTEHMTILSNGHVGIGTSAPALPLQISSTTLDNFLRLTGNGPSVQFIDSPVTSSNRLGKLAFAHASGDYVATAQAGDFVLQNLDSVGSLLFGTNVQPGNGVERMRITSSGYVGIATTTPAAKLDVNCSAVAGKSNPSNIRFENLQSSTGTVLVIDSNGYVYRASSGQTAVTPLATDMQNQIEELKSQVQELRSLLSSKLPLTPAEAGSLNAQTASWLGDNYPNPVSGTTSIQYSLPSGVSAATCQIYSLDGHLVTSISLPPSSGKSQIQVSTAQMPAGMYIYSLVINGKVLDTKKMAVTK